MPGEPEFKYIKYCLNAVRSTDTREFTVDVMGKGEALAHPRDWEERIVPAAVEVTVMGNSYMVARVYTPGASPNFHWLYVDDGNAARIMAQFQRMQEGV